jgi:hypothetical protein
MADVNGALTVALSPARALLAELWGNEEVGIDRPAPDDSATLRKWVRRSPGERPSVDGGAEFGRQLPLAHRFGLPTRSRCLQPWLSRVATPSIGCG